MQENNYEVWRGDTFSVRLEFTDTDGTAIDITGWTIFFTLKRKKKDSDTEALISKTITSIPNPTLGIYTFTLAASELNTFEGMYYYDFQIKLADGKIYTIPGGTITFLVDITRRVS